MNSSFQYADALKSRLGLTTSSSSFDVLKTYENMAERSPTVLKDNFSAQHRTLLDNTPVVFLVVPDLDACALKVPNTDNEAIVAVGPRFSLLLHLMTRASLWAGAHFEELDSKVFQRMARSAAALFAYYTVKRPLEAGDLQGDWFFGESSWNNDVLPTVTFGAICFTVCHEMAHIKLGHLSHCVLHNIEDELTYFGYMQEQEFAADLEGANLYYEGCPKISFQASAPLIVCYTIGLLDYFGQLLSSHDLQMSTHPHGMKRASRLLGRFKPTMNKAETTHAAIMCGVVEGIIKELSNIDLSDIFPGMRLDFRHRQTSYPTLDLLYQVQRQQKQAKP